MWKRIVNGLFFISFIFYGLFLLWTILFKYVAPLNVFSSSREIFFRGVNFIPFNDILNGNYNKFDIIGNVILFIPFGIYIPMLFRISSIYKNIVIFALISLFFEVSQYVFYLGASDVTDIITNTIGGILGLGIYLILKKIFKDEGRIKFFVAICSILVMIFVGFYLIMIILNN
nr:VanZ family protein [Clostridium sp.]